MLAHLSLLATLLPLADTKTDTEKIQGTWEVVRIVAAAEEAKAEAEIKKSRIVIDADKVRFVKDKKSEFPLRYELDPTQKPKAFDLGRFVTQQGIYALDGDELKICLSSEPNKRPTAFPDKPTKGLMLLVLKRGKPIPLAEIIDKNRPSDVVREVLDKAEQLKLLSLDPNARGGGPGYFNGYKVLGSTLVKDKETRKKLLTAFYKGVADSEGVVAACFTPRHGIRATSGGKTVDLVICFQCFSLQIFGPGKEKGGLLIVESPRDTFNKILTDAKVPLPKN